MKTLSLFFLLFFSVTTFASSDRRVVVIVLENTDYNHALQEPAFKALANQGATFTQFSAIATVSQPNYIALTAGDTYGITTNKPFDLNVSHIGDLLEERGMDWRAFGDDYPGDGKAGDCFTQRQYGRYVRKHFPFISFRNVSLNPSRCAKLVNAAQFDKYVSEGRLPAFSLYTPNMDNDGHDTGVKFAAQWISKRLFPLMNTDEGKKITWIFTFDESIGRDYHILTLVVGPRIAPGSLIKEKYNHYSLLRSFEEMWDLGSLQKNDSKATAIPELLK